MVTLIRENWLNAVNATQVTDQVEVPGATKYAVQASTTGSPSTVSLRLEGSLDGVGWFDVLAFSPSSTPTIRWVVDTPVRFIRLNLSQLSGGSSPTVTASVLAI